MRCRVWRDADGFWEWRCPRCSTEYPSGGGSVSWESTMYAVKWHVDYYHSFADNASRSMKHATGDLLQSSN